MPQLSKMDACVDSLQKAVAPNKQVYGFDFTIFIPLVLELIVELLGDCGQDEDEAFETIKKKGFWARYFTRKAVRQTLRDENVKAKSSGAMNAAANDILNWAINNEAVARDGLSEARTVAPGFDKVWG